MNLLGLRLQAHDANMCLQTDNDIKYHNLSRSYNIKHYSVNNYNIVPALIKSVFNVDIDDIDAIAIIHDDNQTKELCALNQSLMSVTCPVYQIDHHFAHSLSADYLRPATYNIVIDGYGDKISDSEYVAWSVFKNNELINRGYFNPELGEFSIGYLYAYIGLSLGIEGNLLDIPSKLMSLQSYGQLDEDFFKFLNTCSLQDIKSLHHFTSIAQYQQIKDDKVIANNSLLNYAHTLHRWLQEQLLEFFKEYVGPTEQINLSGGIGLNICWNRYFKNYFKRFNVPPYTADEGLSIGAVEWLRQHYNVDKKYLNNFPFSDGPIVDTDNFNIDEIVDYLIDGKTVAICQGASEIGPRALGNRSILMRPDLVDGKYKINQIKQRENYRPFGCSVLSQYTTDYFDIDFESPYMLYQAKIKESVKPFLPSITHIDGTSRPQTVAYNNNALLYNILYAFNIATGYPILLNTSLNLAGEPICYYSEQAKRIFYQSNIDMLYLNNDVIKKLC